MVSTSDHQPHNLQPSHTPHINNFAPNPLPINISTKLYTAKMSTSIMSNPYLRTTLHILPLLSTTASLTHAYMEALTTGAFLRAPSTSSALTRAMAKDSTNASTTTATSASAKETAAAKEIVIPIWFTNFFHVGVYSVIGFNTITTTSAAANLYLFGSERIGVSVLGESRMYYVAGLTAALAHFAFVPAVAGSIERLFKLCVLRAKEEQAEEGAAVRALEEWNGRHMVRMMTVDVCAWVCFLVGVVGVLTP
jgi:hypothetical protein